jgi:hypothetical protein
MLTSSKDLILHQLFLFVVALLSRQQCLQVPLGFVCLSLITLNDLLVLQEAAVKYKRSRVAPAVVYL